MRQTVSKWEKGLSVPDADTLLAIGQLFETPVSQLLGEDIYLPAQGDTTAILSQQLACVNEQLAKNLARQGNEAFHKQLYATTKISKNFILQQKRETTTPFGAVVSLFYDIPIIFNETYYAYYEAFLSTIGTL